MGLTWEEANAVSREKPRPRKRLTRNTLSTYNPLWKKQRQKIFFGFDSRFVPAINNCSVCPFAKQTRLSFLLSSIQTKATFDLIHSNISGPHRVTTIDEHRYFVMIVGDYSRSTWIYILSRKDKVFTIIQNIIKLLGTQFY